MELDWIGLMWWERAYWGKEVWWAGLGAGWIGMLWWAWLGWQDRGVDRAGSGGQGLARQSDLGLGRGW